MIADKIYCGNDKIAAHNSLYIERLQIIEHHEQACCESLIARLKNFRCLKQHFCHEVAHQNDFAKALVVICSFQIKYGFWACYKWFVILVGIGSTKKHAIMTRKLNKEEEFELLLDKVLRWSCSGCRATVV